MACHPSSPFERVTALGPAAAEEEEREERGEGEEKEGEEGHEAQAQDDVQLVEGGGPNRGFVPHAHTFQ